MRGQIAEFFDGFFFKRFQSFALFQYQSVASELISLLRGLGLFGRPSCPTGVHAGGIVGFDAVNRANGQAQFAAGAPPLDDGVHAFVGAHNRVRRAGFDAQSTANAPVFVDPHHGAGRLGAMGSAQRQDGAPSDTGQALDARLAARGALVDVRLAGGNGGSVTLAVGVAAARALGMWQRVKDELCQRILDWRLLRLLRCCHLRHRVQRMEH